MNKLLSLDLSTTCTGWAIHEGEKLVDYGRIKPKVKGVTKLKYPVQQLRKMQSLADQIEILILEKKPDLIVIEEVNRHKNRISGKTLDGLHWLVLLKFSEEDLEKVVYMDSDGSHGWRKVLNLQLTDADKQINKEHKKLNKKIAKGETKLPIINKKHLACRMVNYVYKTTFDVDLNSTDSDVVDAIGLGLGYIESLKRDKKWIN